MLSKNIQTFRKQKGLTQEELALRLHVVRQTVSKWEKGISVPDALQLEKLAEILDTNVSTLLGKTVEPESDMTEIAQQLAQISQQLAVKNRRWRTFWKAVGIAAAVILVVNLLLAISGVYTFKTVTNQQSVTVITENTD